MKYEAFQTDSFSNYFEQWTISSYSKKEQEENELVCKTTCSQAYHVVENKGVRVLSNWLQVTDKVHNNTTPTIWLQP